MTSISDVPPSAWDLKGGGGAAGNNNVSLEVVRAFAKTLTFQVFKVRGQLLTSWSPSTYRLGASTLPTQILVLKLPHISSLRRNVTGELIPSLGKQDHEVVSISAK